MKKYLIWSHEHQAWWKQNQFGYTQDYNEAGKFDFETASLLTEEVNRFRSHSEIGPEVSIVPEY